jgi:Arc/MetJ-type ribon-helix-helix transcriptional regulator
MSIRLREEQERRLRAYVDEGRYPSIDDAAQCLFDMVLDDEKESELADLEWVRPYLEEGEQAIREGRVVSGDEFFARIRAKYALPKAE